MTPLDFIKEIAENDYNQAAGEVVEAMHKEIEFLTSEGKLEVLSYYYHEGHMVIDLGD